MEKCFMIPADSSGRAVMEKALLCTSDLPNYTVIGKSILGRDICAYFIGKGRRRVAFFGAHHASESITCNLLFAFMHRFCEGVSSGWKEEMEMYDRYTYTIVPAVNPDGIEIAMHGADSSPLADREKRMLENSSSVWQANARGVDLNHNYDHRFFEYKEVEKVREISPGATLYSGHYPESEPETSAVANLVRVTSPIGIISFHSQGEEILHRRSDKLERICDRLSRVSGYKGVIPDGTAEYGGLCDYTSSLGIPSFTVEVGRGTNPLPLSELDGIFRGLYKMMLGFPRFL